MSLVFRGQHHFYQYPIGQDFLMLVNYTGTSDAREVEKPGLLTCQGEVEMGSVISWDLCLQRSNKSIRRETTNPFSYKFRVSHLLLR